MKQQLLLLSAVLCSATPLLAQGPGGPGGGEGGGRPPQVRTVFVALDADHDGVLSATEIANATVVLKALDKDGDGQLTSLEFLPPQTAPVAPADSYALVARLLAYDTNKDGVLTMDELPERMQPMMTRADTNHDGKLTTDEIRQSASGAVAVGRVQKGGDVTRMDPILAALDIDHDGVLSALEIANAPTELLVIDMNHDGQLVAEETKLRVQTPADRAKHMYDEFDTNKDGKLTKAELPDQMQAQFESIDTNGDGSVDLAEMTAYQAKQPAGRGGGGRPAGTQVNQPAEPSGHAPDQPATQGPATSPAPPQQK